MKDNLSNQPFPDRTHIVLDNSTDVSYWSREFNCTEQGLREAVDVVGHMAYVVRFYLETERSAMRRARPASPGGTPRA